MSRAVPLGAPSLDGVEQGGSVVGVVVEVRRDADGVAAERYCHLPLVQALGEPGPIDGAPHPHPEQVAAAPARLLDPVSALAQGPGQLTGEPAAVLLDRGDGPLQDQLEARREHGQEHEVRAFADVVADGRRLVLVPVADELGERLAAAPGDPVLLDRRTLVEGGAVVGEPHRIRAEQPLVAGADEGIGADPLDVERQGPHRLRPVDDEQGAAVSGAFSDPLEVEQRAVGPVHVGHGDHGGAPVYPGQQPDVPLQGPAGAVPRRRLDRSQLETALGAQPAPDVDVAGKLLFEDDDVVAGRGRDVPGGVGQPVRRRRDDGHAVRVGNVDEPGEQAAKMVAVVEEIFGTDQMRRRPAVDTLNAGGADGGGERRHVRAVQVVYRGGQSELGALAGEHGVARKASPVGSACRPTYPPGVRTVPRRRRLAGRRH